LLTGYDTNGRPNSGTLTLDINGNNQGWFIDTTPGDNSEFDKQLTETAYQATNSPATGKYDLLTVDIDNFNVSFLFLVLIFVFKALISCFVWG
jgi:hypothetical protein